MFKTAIMGGPGGKYVGISPPPSDHPIIDWNNGIQNGRGIAKKIYFLQPEGGKKMTSAYGLRSS